MESHQTSSSSHSFLVLQVALACVDVFGEAGGEEVDYCLRLVRGGWYVEPAVPVEDRLLRVEPGDPKLRYPALAKFPIRVVGVLWKDQGVEAELVNLSRHPGPAPGSAAGRSQDSQVVAQVAFKANDDCGSLCLRL